MATQQELWDGYSRLSSRLVMGTGEKLAAVFSNLGSWREADYQKFLQYAENTVGGAKLQGAKLQTAYYSEMAKTVDEKFKSVPMSQLDLSTPALRNGVTSAEVYRRPFVEVYTALANGKQMTDAIAAGARRAQSIASTDVQLARREAGLRNRQNNQRIVGYRRVLTGSENCALCYVASTQRYTRGDLLPIHPGCDCGEMPIFGTQDPGQVLDQYNLDKAHELVQQRFGVSDRGARSPIDYRDIKIQQHGEMGPVLTVRGQNFTNPSMLPGPRLPDGNFYFDDFVIHESGRKPTALAKQIRARALEVEPAATRTMLDISENLDVEMSGLKFRTKNTDSLARKIRADSVEKGISQVAAAEQIGDSVRYTMVADEANYGRMARQALADLEAQGYVPVKVKNYWQQNNGYMGINVNLVSPEGYKMELQFHTYKSVKVKDPSHKLYEESRKLPNGPEKEAILKQSKELWSSVIMPDDIADIGTPAIQ